MILNEDYFKDLEIEDEDIVVDNTPLDAGGPKHKLSLEDIHKLPEQYDYFISFDINKPYYTNSTDNNNYKSVQIPRIIKRIESVLEIYGIENYEYVLTS